MSEVKGAVSLVATDAVSGGRPGSGPLRARETKGVGSIRAMMAQSAVGAAVFETWVGLNQHPLAELIDPDSYMRLVRIRHGLSAGVFTHVVPEDNGGAGTIVYWSHLLDVFVLALWAPLRAFMPSEQALLVAGELIGPLFAAALAATFVWAPAVFVRSDKRWLWAAPFAGILLAPALTTYGLAGYLHYHLPIILVCVLAAGMAGRALEGRSDAAFACGTAAAFGIWFSPEALPYVAMSMGAIGLKWCMSPALMARPLKAVAGSFAAATAAAWLFDPPNGGYLSPEPDCLSIVYVTLAALVGAGAWIVDRFGRGLDALPARIGLGALLGAVAAGIWLLLFPSIAHGLGGLVPEADVAAYFGAISEMQPLRPSLSSLGLLLPGVCAVVAAFVLAGKTRDPLWAYAALCGCAIVALAQSHIRFVGYSEAAAALMLPVILEFVTDSRLGARAKTTTRISALVMFLAAPAIFTLPFGEKGGAGDPIPRCRVSDIRPALLNLGHHLVLTEISDTPEILWNAPVRTIGSLYHRSIRSFMLARDAWRSAPSDVAPEAVLATKAEFILACERKWRRSLVLDLPDSTLQDRLARNDPPSWLREIAHGGGYHLYFIDKGADGNPDKP